MPLRAPLTAQKQPTVRVQGTSCRRFVPFADIPGDQGNRIRPLIRLLGARGWSRLPARRQHRRDVGRSGGFVSHGGGGGHFRFSLEHPISDGGLRPISDPLFLSDAAIVLYHVVNDRHRRRRSMVFTSNKHPDAWGGVLHDEDLAQAIVDRVLERGRWLKLDGPSIRTKHLGLDSPSAAEGASSQVVRISGTAHPEFPEPTAASMEL